MDGRGSRPKTAGLLRCLSGGGGGAEVAVLRRLSMRSARPLRAAHPRLAAAVAAADWNWNHRAEHRIGLIPLFSTRGAVRKTARLAASFPRMTRGITFSTNLMSLHASIASNHYDALVRALPPTLRTTGIYCPSYTHVIDAVAQALCRHLRELRELDLLCSAVSVDVVAALPPTLRRLCIELPDGGARLDHLTDLVCLDVCHSSFSDASLASLPRGLTTLMALYTQLTDGARFAHLPRLRTLGVSYTRVGDAALASAPRSLVTLWASHTALGASARFAHLLRLRALYVASTAVGDAAIASAPRSLAQLEVCHTALTDGARFAHLPRLRFLDVRDTGVTDAALASVVHRAEVVTTANEAAWHARNRTLY